MQELPIFIEDIAEAVEAAGAIPVMACDPVPVVVAVETAVLMPDMSMSRWSIMNEAC